MKSGAQASPTGPLFRTRRARVCACKRGLDHGHLGEPDLYPASWVGATITCIVSLFDNNTRSAEQEAAEASRRPGRVRSVRLPDTLRD